MTEEFVRSPLSLTPYLVVWTLSGVQGEKQTEDEILLERFEAGLGVKPQ